MKKQHDFKKILYSNNVAGYVFSLPFIVGFLGFTLIPILVSMYYSFTDYKLGQELSFIGLKNYIDLFADERFMNSMKVTVIYVVISVPVKLAFALLVAYFLTKKRKGVTLYRSLYYVPSLIGGSVAVALVWKTIFSRRGLANAILAGLGFDKISWLGNPKTAMGILIAMAAWQFGSSMIIFAAGLKEIPTTYYEAADIDGANKFQRFIKITLPCLSPIICITWLCRQFLHLCHLHRLLLLHKAVQMILQTFMHCMSIITRLSGQIWDMRVQCHGLC